MAKLKINGKVLDLAVDDEMPLLWALREAAGLIGTKYGCGIGACGACTVLIDGTARRSCSIKVGEVTPQATIVTIEGLSADVSHPVQRAWIELDVAQCGYCQAGMILAAVALLARSPEPTDAEIDGAISNLCRCGTYQRVRAAIKRAAEIGRGP
jgi:isoquinoline 1-oxidoreductase alpha subunit